MMPITLQVTPNQEFQFNADGQQYDCRLWFDGDDMMFLDVTLNGTVIASSCPCLVNQQIMPYAYLEGAGGNFFFVTASGNNPIYENFGGADVLLYATNAELADERAAIALAATTIALTQTQAL